MNYQISLDRAYAIRAMIRHFQATHAKAKA